MGDGSDEINENTGSGADTLLITGGILPADVRTWVDSSDNFYIHLTSTEEEIKIYGSKVETVIFDNGTVWDLTQGLFLNDLDIGQSIDGTSYADTIHGNGGDDTLDGDDGDDVLDGGSGDDKLYGGTGNDVLGGGADGDYLYGDEGNDMLDGGSGNDHLYGDVGNDMLEGGSGNDRLYGSHGDDVYVWKAGYGNDHIHENIGQGNDMLLLTGGILPEDVRTWVDGNEDFHIHLVSTGEELEVYGSGSTTDVGSRLESIAFDNGTVWDLSLIHI